ncbi:DUF932 domain-containing protein [Paludisphaera rhizosphaerae]|uniref:DUF932 domain-containing protein n=1 Tax=Paludisphaera rhizosphaerae TaxID=2711216 RepID=UPI0013EAFDA8|nr:DUF932 domain-containing protein [Paludisphaera rhizosphaerae]
MVAILSREQLQASAPSVFAASPWERMSGRYRMVPTIDVVDMLGEQGFRPVRALQGRTRIPGKGDFTRHLIRFRHDDHIGPLAVGQELPELVLTNSHDGTAAYQFMAGVFRLVCSNGLTVQSADFGSISIRHSGGADFRERVIDATYQVIDQAPRSMAAIEGWKGISLTRPQQLAMASAAHEIRPNDAIKPAFLLTARRNEDYTDAEGNRDLWTTANVLQENLVQGGLRGRASTGRRVTTRPIKGVAEDIRTNRALWRLTEEMAKLA